MKKTLLIPGIAVAIIAAAFCTYYFGFKTEQKQESQNIQLVKHKKAGDTPMDDIKRAIQEEEKLLKDPRTGKIPAGIRGLELAQAREIYRNDAMLRGLQGARTQATTYTYQGPGNLGGRTRALAFDISDATSNTILAGSVSGGVFRTTNGGTTWTRVNPVNELFTITSIAQDPRPGNQTIWYYAGGEALGNSASDDGAFYAGHGIYKSINSGVTWARLATSNTGNINTFDNRADFISKLVVNPANGDVYAACIGQILRSQNGGATWTAVQTSAGFNNSDQLTDVAITSTGRVYTAFSGTTSNGSNTVNGVWTSATGDLGSYTRLSGTGAATSPANWEAYGSYGRVVLSIAPSNEDLVYALYDDGDASSCSGTPAIEAEFFRWSQSGGAWTDLSLTLPDEAGCSNGNDPFAVQGGYDLVVSVKPDNANTLVIGGTNVYRSTDAGLSWTRIGGYASSANYTQYTNHHPDIHALVFRPSNPNILFSGTDGGIHSGDVTAGTVAWTSLNNNYQTYQYYHVAIKQEAGVNAFIGGAQDNGTTTTLAGGTSFSLILGADGVAVGLGSGAAPYKQYCGSQNGTMYRRNSSQGTNFIEANLTPPGVASIFITYFLLDPDNTQNLYYAGQVAGVNRLLRITNASTATNASWQTFTFSSSGYIRAMATTRGTYSATSRLYMGTENGVLYRLTDPVNAATSTTPDNITPTGMTGGGTVIGIAVNPQNHNEILVVYSNYGVVSVWHTTTAGNASPTWTNVEGNLTLPSYRSAMIVKTGALTEYYVGTSVGLYKSNLMAGAGTIWTQEGASEIGNSIVTGLSLRTADNTFAIGTHGSGMWRGASPSPTLPVQLTDFTGTLVKNSAHLKWTTTQEIRNKGFEIEKSYDGVSFTKLGFVKGVGNSAVSTSYTFIDKDVAQDDNYYRLRQLDVDNNPTYSTVILLRNKGVRSQDIVVLQNPFTTYLDIQLPRREAKQFTAKLVDLSGRIVYNRTINSELTRQRLDFGSLNLAGGTYLLQVSDGSKNYITKVLKQ